MAIHRKTIEERALRRCEYCLAPQNITGYSFHIEHIVPRAKGGKNELSNFALACASCNFSKADHLTGYDNKSGKEERLFNPRKDKWREHFRFSRAELKIIGKSAIGRATENRLQLNGQKQIEARELWTELEIYP